MQNRIRLGVRGKLILTVITSAVIIILAIIGIGYFWGTDILKEQIGSGYLDIADMVSKSIDVEVTDKVRDFGMFVYGLPLEQIAAIDDENRASYQQMGDKELKEYFERMDQEWSASDQDSPLIKKYKDNPLGERMRVLVRKEEASELFITDSYGGLIACSGKITDFYQADEQWWIRAYNNGKGAFYIGDPEYDESSGVVSITLAEPLYARNGAVLGVCKMIVEISSFFNLLEVMKYGIYNVTVCDAKGNIIYSRFVKPLSRKFCDPDTFNWLITSKKDWVVINNCALIKERILVAHQVVKNNYLSDAGVMLNVFTWHKTRNIFHPLYDFIYRLLWLGCLSLVFWVIVALITGNKFARPIMAMKDVVEKVGKGQLNSRIEIKTGDEIEILADSFNKMTFELEKTMVSIDKLNHEIKERKAAEVALNDMLSDLKKTQQQLVQSEKFASIGQLSAGIAHEINNPVGFIGSNISTLEGYMVKLSEYIRSMEILKTTILSGDRPKMLAALDEVDKLEKAMDINTLFTDIDNIVRESKEGIERIKNIVVDLKTFSRTSDKARMPCDINKILDGVINIIWNEIKYKSELVKEYGDIPIIDGHSQQLGQVFINLLVNAAQAIKEKGVITVRTYVHGKNVCVDIEDTGEGIPEDKMKMLFEPFFTTKAPGKGTGLGLSISYDIIENHGGRIDVESEVSKGTKFTVTLPVNKG